MIGHGIEIRFITQELQCLIVIKHMIYSKCAEYLVIGPAQAGPLVGKHII